GRERSFYCFLRVAELTRDQLNVTGITFRDEAFPAAACHVCRSASDAVVLSGFSELAPNCSDTTSVYENASKDPSIRISFQQRVGDVAMTQGFINVASVSFQRSDAIVQIS